MGENATEGLFIGLYVFIFIVALSSTIVLFVSINNYADLAYEYGKNIENSGTLIEGTPTTTYRVVTADQAVAYYYNYINNDTSESYEVSFVGLSEDLKKGDSYQKVIDTIGMSSFYILKYESAEIMDNGKKKAKITIEKTDQTF